MHTMKMSKLLAAVLVAAGLSATASAALADDETEQNREVYAVATGAYDHPAAPAAMTEPHRTNHASAPVHNGAHHAATPAAARPHADNG